jgi:hypothetical protein
VPSTVAIKRRIVIAAKITTASRKTLRGRRSYRMCGRRSL